MGIRYYAYAFDAELTERALADPGSILSRDPLADAWGLGPERMIGGTSFEQSVPARDLLYLDKAWPHLQHVTRPGPGRPAPRPACRMFEGQVTMRDLGWDPWVRALAPAEIPAIAHDLSSLDDAEARGLFRSLARWGGDPDDEADYALTYLRKARTFVADLATENRGLVYVIG